MATLVLRVVGTAIGGMFGPVGAAIGSAIGATAGMMVDQRLFGSTREVEGARLSSSRPMAADEGHPIPRAYGYTRIPGSVIWATRLVETATTTRSGGKGGGGQKVTTTTYSYAGNVAVAICEGPVGMVKRIWADGKELDRRDINIRIYRGHESQPLDPLIQAKQGANNTPAYKGVVYVVFENLALERFANRIPQFEFEVVRPVGKLEKQIKAMCLIPGSTEYGLATTAINRREFRSGNTFESAFMSANARQTNEVNRHVLYGDTDFDTSLDELLSVCPNLRHVSLVIPWFGDDLRAGHCTLKPGVIENESELHSVPWQVSGLSRFSPDAHLISKHQGRSSYGGTPTDTSVIEAITRLKARGLSVTINPFIMMDIPTSVSLPDPWGASKQAAYPWRGRITCYPGHNQPGSAEATAQAADQISSFLGNASRSDFSVLAGQIHCASSDFGYRRFILHCAYLAMAAGGVDAFLIGSEMRSLTTMRDHAGRFPFVDGLRALATDVHAVLGSSTKLTYGADWSEYFGYHPADGSGDVFFHLDPLWADPNIAAVGIDNYMPLSDWRDDDSVLLDGNPDGAYSAYDYDAMRGALTAGEGFDWYYSSQSARRSRSRTPITDGAYGKHWTFRYKDIAGWWSNRHYERRGGVELSSHTPWVPRSKPIWLSEFGCPAVDKGANQPNVFSDPKSAENALPYFSSGARDDAAQRIYLQAMVDGVAYDQAFNPVAPTSSGRMIDPDRVYAWAWDMRPFPAFPLNDQVWGDGDNWIRGHWLNGRLGAVPDGELAASITRDHGLPFSDTGAVSAVFQGCHFSGSVTGRAMIEAIAEVSDLSFNDSWISDSNALEISISSARPVVIIEPLDLVDDGKTPIFNLTRSQRSELATQCTMIHSDGLQDYRLVATSYSRGEADIDNIATVDTALQMDDGLAAKAAERVVTNQWNGRDTLSVALPMDHLQLEPGDVFVLADKPDQRWRITRTELGNALHVSAIRTARAKASSVQSAGLRPIHERAFEGDFGGPPVAVFLDLPLLTGDDPMQRFCLAVSGLGGKTYVALASSTDQDFSQRSSHRSGATIGSLVAQWPPGQFSGRFDNSAKMRVQLYSGELESSSETSLFAGRNAVAIETESGFEIVQFLKADEVEPEVWQLSGLLRGQGGTEDHMRLGAPEGAAVILLDENINPVGLSRSERGLPLHWRVGQNGKELSDRFFTHQIVSGGQRAFMPLSPVHLTTRFVENGDLQISWIRRDRDNADSWENVEIPMSEAQEAYVLSVAGSNGSEIERTVSDAVAIISASEVATLGGTASLEVRQISTVSGPGLPATKTIEIPV